METEEREIEITIRIKTKRVTRNAWAALKPKSLGRPVREYCSLCDSHGTLRNGDKCPSC